MTHNNDHPKSAEDRDPWPIPIQSDHQKESDPLCNILEKVSSKEPSPFFARNVIRETRKLSQKPTLRFRIKELFSAPRVALGTISLCICSFLIYQTLHQETQQNIASSPPTIEVDTAAESSDSENFKMSEFIIEETLIAAADNPSLFTHDEVLAMVGF